MKNYTTRFKYPINGDNHYLNLIRYNFFDTRPKQLSRYIRMYNFPYKTKYFYITLIGDNVESI